jgi:hypothetical protein
MLSLFAHFTNHCNHSTHKFFSVCCFHQSLSGDGSQECPLFPCSRSYRLATVSQLTRCQSQSYVTTDGQSASLFWCQAPIWSLRPDFYYCQTVVGLMVRGALSDERTSNCYAYKISALIAHKRSLLCCCFQLLPCRHACLRSRCLVTAVV